METESKFMLLVVILVFAFPIIYLFLSVFLQNWLVMALIIAGLITLFFCNKYIFSRGGNETNSFHGVP